jgi:hypothetical protein
MWGSGKEQNNSGSIYSLEIRENGEDFFVDVWAQLVLTSLLAVFASSGFWAYVIRRSDKKSTTTKLLMGIVYDRLVHLGDRYIDRGWITRDEYEDFLNYFYEPYKALGGNGGAERIMNEVSKLPIRSSRTYDEVFQMRARNGENIDHGRITRREETTA